MAAVQRPRKVGNRAAKNLQPRKKKAPAIAEAAEVLIGWSNEVEMRAQAAACLEVVNVASGIDLDRGFSYCGAAGVPVALASLFSFFDGVKQLFLPRLQVVPPSALFARFSDSVAQFVPVKLVGTT
jgi:hypothetical protein